MLRPTRFPRTTFHGMHSPLAARGRGQHVLTDSCNCPHVSDGRRAPRARDHRWNPPPGTPVTKPNMTRPRAFAEARRQRGLSRIDAACRKRAAAQILNARDQNPARLRKPEASRIRTVRRSNSMNPREADHSRMRVSGWLRLSTAWPVVGERCSRAGTATPAAWARAADGGCASMRNQTAKRGPS
jgi:hypothetical protein